MSKRKFIRADIQGFCQDAGLSIRKATELTDRIIDAMAAALVSGNAIELRGFGSLETKERKASARRNPRTGEAVIVPPRRYVRFTPGRELKTALRGANRPAPEGDRHE